MTFVLSFLISPDIVYPETPRCTFYFYNPQLTHFDLTKNALTEFKERDKIAMFTEDKCWKFNANTFTEQKVLYWFLQ